MNVFQLNYRHGLRAALIAAIGACTLWIGYLAGWGERASLAGSQAPAQEAPLEEIRLAPDYALLGLGEDLAETTARPLFNASRRPLPGAAPAESGKSGALSRGRYALTGVSIAPGARVALLLELATNKTVRVEQNKEVNGILLESVTPTKAIIRMGAEREEIPLKIAPAPKLAAVTPPNPARSSARGPDAAAGAAPPGSPPLPPMPTPPAAAALPGAPPAAADIANADPITDADVAERRARVQARRSRQSAREERAPR